LGLPIVAKIIEDHGGKLELLDAPDGKGALVRMLLPMAPTELAEKALRSEQPSHVEKSGA
jgi:two-component system nitrogen regulation sensor histidine kinase NtrY